MLLVDVDVVLQAQSAHAGCLVSLFSEMASPCTQSSTFCILQPPLPCIYSPITVGALTGPPTKAQFDSLSPRAPPILWGEARGTREGGRKGWHERGGKGWGGKRGTGRDGGATPVSDCWRAPMPDCWRAPMPDLVLVRGDEVARGPFTCPAQQHDHLALGVPVHQLLACRGLPRPEQSEESCTTTHYHGSRLCGLTAPLYASPSAGAQRAPLYASPSAGAQGAHTLVPPCGVTCVIGHEGEGLRNAHVA